MPFDAAGNRPAINRAVLIDALRGQLPEKFTWDFGTFLEEKPCGSVGCALGLAVVLGITKGVDYKSMASAIGISEEDSARIFEPDHEVRGDDDDGPLLGYGVDYSEVTP